MKIKIKKSNNGRLNIIQKFPFNVKRVYFLNKLKKGNKRFGHAHKELEQIYICLQGSFTIKLIDKKNNIKIIELNEKKNLLKIHKMIWRDIITNEDNSILLVLASKYYNKNDYIRNLKSFLKNES
jgi:dTDP-4-dehydrorhamnose 3,5-epimerase-like enzyme